MRTGFYCSTAQASFIRAFCSTTNMMRARFMATWTLYCGQENSELIGPNMFATTLLPRGFLVIANAYLVRDPLEKGFIRQGQIRPNASSLSRKYCMSLLPSRALVWVALGDQSSSFSLSSECLKICVLEPEQLQTDPNKFKVSFHKAWQHNRV